MGEDFLGSRGGLHAASGTDEQRVVEQRAQARQRGADGRLAEEQFLCGAGHAAFVHQGLEHDQQVQIDAAQVVSVHGVPRFQGLEAATAGARRQALRARRGGAWRGAGGHRITDRHSHYQ